MSRSSTAPRAAKRRVPAQAPAKPGFFARLWAKATSLVNSLLGRVKKVGTTGARWGSTALEFLGTAVWTVASFVTAALGLIGALVVLVGGFALAVGLHLLRAGTLVLGTPAMALRRSYAPWKLWLATAKMWLTPRRYATYLRDVWSESTSEFQTMRANRAQRLATGSDTLAAVV